jgi:Gpi18-like mannosyltransferase
MNKIFLSFSNKIKGSTFQQQMEQFRKIDYFNILVIAAGLILAILIRYSLLEYKSPDYLGKVSHWYNFIRSNGFSAFATNFSNYNPPYLYLFYLVIRSDPDLPTVIGAKIPGLICDFICAYYVYRIVKVKNTNSMTPLIAAVAVLFAPTVILNSAYWGQSDSIYTAALTACIYYLIVRKNWLSMLAYGIALSFKLQAIFVAPVLLALFLRKMVNWKELLLIPAVLFLSLIPSWIAGRPISDLLNVYLHQSSQFETITMNAPSIYTWVPQTKEVFNLLYVPGILLGGVMAFLLVVLIYKSQAELTPSTIIELSLISFMLIPFFLPKMHERYFFPADVISIAFAFYFPQLFFIPIAMSAVSFLSYEPYLFEQTPVPFPVLTLGLLIAICLLVKNVITNLYASEANRTAVE